MWDYWEELSKAKVDKMDSNRSSNRSSDDKVSLLSDSVILDTVSVRVMRGLA